MDNIAFERYWKKLNSSKNKQIMLKEAKSEFKGGPLQSKRTRTFFHWMHGELPATFDVDFKYKVNFNIKEIEKVYTIETFVDWDGFHNEIVKPNFSERGIWIKVKNINISEFKPIYAIYNSEADDKSLNPKRKANYIFSHTITLQAQDRKRIYKKSEIQKIAQDFVNKFEKDAYSDTAFYKIAK